ncbi:MAG: peptidoglycan-binding domain-containing protein, partial [Methylocella sp.]
LSTARRRGSRQIRRRGWRYLCIFATGFFVVTATAILLNALVWQRTRHPAPLFARAAPPAAAHKPATTKSIAVPPPPQPQPAAPAVQAKDKPVDKPQLEMPAARANTPPPRDEISQFLTMSAASPARPQAAAEKPSARGKSVLAAQRALVKLGFVLNPDGLAGTETRRAIIRYERDHGLAVNGEVTPALIRRLSAETGITID